jgi:CheY-like chemotaxis protein
MHDRSARILLVGADGDEKLQRYFRAAGCVVVSANGNQEALERARHERFDCAVLISKDSLITVTETIFNLRDVNRSIEIIVIVDARRSSNDRFLRQLIGHPISGTRIMTRRELWEQLQATGPPTDWPAAAHARAVSLRGNKKA